MEFRFRMSSIFILGFFFSPVASSVENLEDEVDLCQDVSYFGDPSYKNEECLVCDTEFQTVCHQRQLEVCARVPHTTCKLLPYAECKMTTRTIKYNSTDIIFDNPFIPFKCINETRQEIYRKIVPICLNVTRQDCVTKWELNTKGEKVWTGNEFCSPVTWENCSLIEQLEAINQTYTSCLPDPSRSLQLTQCRLVEKSRTVNEFLCEIKHSVHCECVHKSECDIVKYKECTEEPKPMRCQKKRILVPHQPKVHRVKCLLKDDLETPHITAEVDRPVLEVGRVQPLSVTKPGK